MSRRQSASPKKDRNDTWSFMVDLGVGPDGKRRQAHRRGFPTKRAAQEALDNLRNDRREGTFVPPSRQTFAQFLLDDWLPTVARTRAESTVEDYTRKCRNHVIPTIGHIPVQAIDGTTLNRLYAQLLETGRLRGSQSPGLKPRTVRYIHTIVHAAFADAVRWRHVKFNPADLTRRPQRHRSLRK